MSQGAQVGTGSLAGPESPLQPGAQVAFIHRRPSPPNLGDHLCSPKHYFAFETAGETDSVAIIGGGTYNDLGVAAATSSDRRVKVLWGVGRSIPFGKKLGKPVDRDAVARQFVRVSVRDPEWADDDYQLVPCPSVFHPICDQPPGNGTGLFLNANPKTSGEQVEDLLRSCSSRFPGLITGTNADGEVDFLRLFSLTERVITNSYHVGYWSLLSGRALLLIGYSSKFASLMSLFGGSRADVIAYRKGEGAGLSRAIDEAMRDGTGFRVADAGARKQEFRERNDRFAAELVRSGLFKSVRPVSRHAALAVSEARRLKGRRDWSGVRTILSRLTGRSMNLSAQGFKLLVEAHQRHADLAPALECARAAAAVHPDRPELDAARQAVEATGAEIQALREFCESLRSEDCIVFGSAPDPQFGEAGFRGEKLVCCNGSAATLNSLFRLEPDFSFIHSHVLARDTESDRDVRHALRRVERLGKTVVLKEPQHRTDPDAILSKSAEVLRFGWSYRFYVLKTLLDTSIPYLDISTGAFSVAACLLAGARSVKLVGMSLAQAGHSYNVKGRYRNHVASDAALYALLAARGYPITASDPSIAMICVNKLQR